ncbi:MAG: XrtA/PEP-CTERM system exopolysaccharide export protein, partial [Stellaceae bacterium]
WGVTTVLRQVYQSAFVLALVLLAGCSSFTDLTDRVVGNSDPNPQTYTQNYSAPPQPALSVPPNMNDRPLPAPSHAQYAAPRPMTAQMAAAQPAGTMPVQPPAAATPMAAAPRNQTASAYAGAQGGTIDPNSDTYLIGPGDNLDIFVWQNPQLSVKVPVRPDGKISIPLVQDVAALGRTPSILAHDISERLKAYVKDPNVTVIVSSFVGPFSQQIRVIGEAAKPQAIPYRSNMTILDVMIEVGGLTRFAAGDRSVVVRNFNGQHQTIHTRLDSLINDGDVRDNIAMRPGDIVIIPQRYF